MCGVAESDAALLAGAAGRRVRCLISRPVPRVRCASSLSVASVISELQSPVSASDMPFHSSVWEAGAC